MKGRFWGKVQRRAISECWPWTGAILKNGYGAFNTGGGITTAHRLAFRFTMGEIARGVVIDHLCRNRACCNPRHLDAVSNKENCQRGLKGRMVTACAKGHPYTKRNTGRHATGRRFCRTCRRARDRKRLDAAYWRAWRARRHEGVR